MPNKHSRRSCSMHGGQDGEDGEGEEVGVLENVPAGALLEGLALQCVDAAGRPVPANTPGKARCSILYLCPCTALTPAGSNVGTCASCTVNV